MTRQMLFVAISTLFLLPGCTNPNQGGLENTGWISLFNGRDLEGWKVKITGHELGDNFGDTFRVEDSVMKVSYDQYDNFDGKFGHIFLPAKVFSLYFEPGISFCGRSGSRRSRLGFPQQRNHGA